MTHKLIKTDNYLLIISDEEIKENDYWFDGTNIRKDCSKQLIDGIDKKIIAHLPLNNSVILKRVDLLPPLEQEDDVENLIKKYFEKDKKLNNPSSFKVGYNKAKEKYKFTEEDMWKAFEYGKTLKGFDWIGDLIQSLSQPNYPIAFECQMGTKYFEDNSFIKGQIRVSNQKGKTLLVGRYIYND